MEAARDLWQSAASFDGAAQTAEAEALRRERSEQLATAPPPAPVATAPVATVPPAAVAVSTPEARPTQRPAAPAAVDETAGVLAAITRYARAMESRDLAVVRRVWPSAPDRLGDGLREAASLQMRIDCGQEVHTQGATATATCSRSQEIRPKAGKAQSATSKVRFRLHKAGETWLIDGIEAP